MIREKEREINELRSRIDDMQFSIKNLLEDLHKTEVIRKNLHH
jgi:hypothetical protein